jgi:hypothetical protein
MLLYLHILCCPWVSNVLEFIFTFSIVWMNSPYLLGLFAMWTICILRKVWALKVNETTYLQFRIMCIGSIKIWFFCERTLNHVYASNFELNIYNTNEIK